MSSRTTATMRAVSPRAWGAPDVLVPVEVDRPEPGITEILVKVHAAGVNPVDWKTRAAGEFGTWGDTPILGYDVSGTVEAVGPGVTLFAPGDEVFGMPRFPEQAGGYAEYVVAPARRFARKPANIDHVEAAALPLAALTAWQGLIETAELRAGQRVLIHDPTPCGVHEEGGRLHEAKPFGVDKVVGFRRERTIDGDDVGAPEDIRNARVLVTVVGFSIVYLAGVAGSAGRSGSSWTSCWPATRWPSTTSSWSTARRTR